MKCVKTAACVRYGVAMFPFAVVLVAWDVLFNCDDDGAIGLGELWEW